MSLRLRALQSVTVFVCGHSPSPNQLLTEGGGLYIKLNIKSIADDQLISVSSVIAPAHSVAVLAPMAELEKAKADFRSPLADELPLPRRGRLRFCCMTRPPEPLGATDHQQVGGGQLDLAIGREPVATQRLQGINDASAMP